MRIILQECKMDLLRAVRYRVGMISDLVLFTVLLVFFLISDTGTSFGEEYGTGDYKTLLLLGYVAWTLSSAAINTVAPQISGEVQRGTFFLKINSRIPMQFIYFGDFLAAIAIQSVIAIICTVGAHFIWNTAFVVRPDVIAALIVCTIGMYGIGLIIAGFQLFFKRVGSLVFVLQLGLLFVTDTLPTSGSITRITSILPLTRCNAIIREALTGTAAAAEYIGLLLCSAVCFAVGYAVFEIFLRMAKKKGNLLMY